MFGTTDGVLIWTTSGTILRKPSADTNRPSPTLTTPALLALAIGIPFVLSIPRVFSIWANMSEIIILDELSILLSNIFEVIFT